MTKVLVVDDAPFMRQMIRDILLENDFDVVGEASDGNEAVVQYNRLKPDLVTMDIVMPQLSGIEAARAILADDPGARIIIISAIGQESMITEAMDCGVLDYIIKPFRREDVIESAQRVAALP